jgi:tRNA threonylcarbamoyladenosine biosynthesis protein TsaE
MSSPDDTARFAARLGRLLVPGDCILLNGSLGAGKTHFARSLIQSVLSNIEDVPSPTFTLVQTYDTDVGPIWHADLYRINGADEIEELGLTEAMEDAICLIEWPDRLGDLKPDDALVLQFTAQDDPDARAVTATWTDEKWSARLERAIQ